jgi:putative aldouronate transport system permease protein
MHAKKKANIQGLAGFVFDSGNYLFMTVLCIGSMYVFLYLATLSLSPATASFSTIRIFPQEITFTNYAKVFADSYVLSGFANSLARTLLGTALTVTVAVLLAYPLAKRYLPHRMFWTMTIVFTMFFSGGLIPTYLLVKGLGLHNTIWALVLPMLVHTFQMIITRNFFMSLPEELEEAAKIDGANEFKTLYKIVVPLSMPIIAVLALWTAVYHWNEWFYNLIFMSDPNKHVLQMVMRRVVLEGMVQDMTMTEEEAPVNPETVKAATVMVTMLPIILMYPFVQRYFVKGILIGSLKG